MTKGGSSDKPLLRHPGQVRQIGAVLSAVTRLAFRGAGPAAAQLAADWPMVVGAALAAVCTPRRVSAGTLTLGCSGPVAMELQHLAPQLIERVNLHLGRATVQRIRLVQEAARPAGVAVARGAAGGARGPQTPRAVRRIDGMAEGPLRDALERLGVVVGRAED